MRVILRFSVNGDRGGAVGKALAWHLKNVKMKNTGTGTWELQSISPGNLALAMTGFWKTVGEPANVHGAAKGVSIDHVWLYCDAS
jgi:hypothetical protein